MTTKAGINNWARGMLSPHLYPRARAHYNDKTDIETLMEVEVAQPLNRSGIDYAKIWTKSWMKGGTATHAEIQSDFAESKLESLVPRAFVRPVSTQFAIGTTVSWLSTPDGPVLFGTIQQQLGQKSLSVNEWLDVMARLGSHPFVPPASFLISSSSLSSSASPASSSASSQLASTMPPAAPSKPAIVNSEESTSMATPQTSSQQVIVDPETSEQRCTPEELERALNEIKWPTPLKFQTHVPLLQSAEIQKSECWYEVKMEDGQTETLPHDALNEVVGLPPIQSYLRCYASNGSNFIDHPFVSGCRVSLDLLSANNTTLKTATAYVVGDEDNSRSAKTLSVHDYVPRSYSMSETKYSRLFKDTIVQVRLATGVQVSVDIGSLRLEPFGIGAMVWAWEPRVKRYVRARVVAYRRAHNKNGRWSYDLDVLPSRFGLNLTPSPSSSTSSSSSSTSSASSVVDAKMSHVRIVSAHNELICAEEPLPVNQSVLYYPNGPTVATVQQDKKNGADGKTYVPIVQAGMPDAHDTTSVGTVLSAGTVSGKLHYCVLEIKNAMEAREQQPERERERERDRERRPKIIRTGKSPNLILNDDAMPDPLRPIPAEWVEPARQTQTPSKGTSETDADRFESRRPYIL